MPAPRRPYFLTPSASCWAARSGCCSATVAKATKRSGCAALASASFSFCSLMSWLATSRSVLYQYGLMLSASTSMPCSSIARIRSDACVAMCSSGGSVEPGVESFIPIRAIASGTAQCACTSTVLTRRPPTITSRRCACARAGAAARRSQPTNAMPASAPAVVPRNSLRVFMVALPRLVCDLHPPELLHGQARMPDLRHVPDLVAVEVHHVHVVRFRALSGRGAGAAVAGMRPGEDAVRTDALAPLVGGKRLQVVSSVGNERQQAPHPVGVL